MADTQTEAGSVPATGHTNLWLDDFAGMFGFRWVAAQLPWELPPSYLYAIRLRRWYWPSSRLHRRCRRLQVLLGLAAHLQDPL